ncbi:hypothetical protein [Deinococcus alpinitundrae]|uniref:hypothetical protein n=1 Tax=Deinococcus alpinitundrae TaxID=468913 RepID=UPI00137A3DCD|nr:hypothetical protein [Deinococcus alpinitundrae]
MNALLARTPQKHAAMSLSLSCPALTSTPHNDIGSLRRVAAQADGDFAAGRLLLLTPLDAAHLTTRTSMTA